MSLQAGVWYTITNKATGTVADYSQSNFRSLIGYTLHGGTNQIWTLEPAGNGQWYIRSGHGVYISFQQPTNNGDALCLPAKKPFQIIPDFIDKSLWRVVEPSTKFVLDLRGAGRADGTGVCLYSSHDGRHQAWSFKAVYNNYIPSAPVVYLNNLKTSTVAKAAGTKVSGSSKTKETSQIWLLEEADKSRAQYYVKSIETSQYLGFSGSPSSSKGLETTATKQPWTILAVPNDPSLVKLYVPDTNYLIDLTASNPAEGTPLILYPTQNPGLNQQWKVEPAQ